MTPMPPPFFFSKRKRLAKPKALSSSLMKYSFPINRKVLHFKRLNRMLLENSFQLVNLKNWKNSKERIFSWHLSFDFHLDKFLFAPRTCLRILFFWDRKRSVDSHVWRCCTSSLTQIVYLVVLTRKEWSHTCWHMCSDWLYEKCWYYSDLFHHFIH